MTAMVPNIPVNIACWMATISCVCSRRDSLCRTLMFIEFACMWTVFGDSHDRWHVCDHDGVYTIQLKGGHGLRERPVSFFTDYLANRHGVLLDRRKLTKGFSLRVVFLHYY